MKVSVISFITMRSMANEGIVNGVNRLQDVYNFPKCSQHIKPSSKVITSMIISRVF